MDLRLNLALLVSLGTAWGALSPTLADPGPADASHLRRPGGDLRDTEDAVARDPSHGPVLKLARAYLDLQRPALALAVLEAAPAAALDGAEAGHLRARAYEQSGQLARAQAVATATVSRCRDAGAAGDPRCPPRWLPTLEGHLRAIVAMRAWGVRDPARDPRTGRAYALAFRTARIASASPPAAFP